MRFQTLVLLTFGAGLAAACAAPRAPEPGPLASSTGTTPPAESLGAARSLEVPWTDEFLDPALLLADRIVVEGPRGLLQHAVLRQEPRVQYSSETTPEGLRQTLRPADGASAIELRAQIDQWNLVALRELVLLERPGEVPVTVRASGNVLFRPFDGGEILRSQSLEREGAIERP